MKRSNRIALGLLVAVMLVPVMMCAQATSPLVFEGTDGPGNGKHIVFVVGDQWYRSEESMPAMARILAEHHGFKCTVLMAVDPATGQADSSVNDNIPGLEALRTADLMVMFTRWLELPDDQMKEILDYTNSGRPIVALRTSTHPFDFRKRTDSPYAKYSWQSTSIDGGYGRLVLGETWIRHYGAHQKESTRALPAPGMEEHPILTGVDEIWGPSDIYEITTLSGDSQPILMGHVLTGMEPTSPEHPTKKPLPVAWTKTYTGELGKTSRIFMTTMGHNRDFEGENFRRLLVNGCYWALEMESSISAESDVSFTAPYKTSPIGLRERKQ